MEEGFVIAVVKALKDHIENFKEVVSYYSELEPLKDKFETIEKVVDYINKNTRCLQEDLKKIYPDIDPSLLYKCAFGMEACGLIKRERAGNTFRLVYQDAAQPTNGLNSSQTDIISPLAQKRNTKVSTKWLAHSIKTDNPLIILLPFRKFREDKYQSQQKRVIGKLVTQHCNHATKKRPLIDDNIQDVLIDSRIVRFLACIRRPSSLKASLSQYNASSTNALSLIELSEYLPRELPQLKFNSQKIEYNTDCQIPFLPHNILRHKSLLKGEAFITSTSERMVYIYDKSFTCLGSFDASAYSLDANGLKCIGISPDLNYVLITVLPDAYLFGKNFNLVRKLKTAHPEGLSFEDRIWGEGHEWIYGVGFSSDSKFFYLGCSPYKTRLGRFPGRTYKMSLEGNVVAVYVMPEDSKSQTGTNPVYSIIEIQDYLYIVSFYYIYILRDGQFIKTVEKNDHHYKWFEQGFIAINDLSCAIYDLEGNDVAILNFPEKIRHIAFSEGLLLIETSKKAYLFSISCQD